MQPIFIQVILHTV